MLPGLEDRGTVELGTLNVADDQTPLFTSTFHESIFLAAVLCGQAFNLTPFGAVSKCLTTKAELVVQTIYSSNLIAERLSAEGDQGQLTWILSAYSLTTGSFVLVGGSLGDTVGPRPVWIFSLVWVMVFNLSQYGIKKRGNKLSLLTQYPDLHGSEPPIFLRQREPHSLL